MTNTNQKVAFDTHIRACSLLIKCSDYETESLKCLFSHLKAIFLCIANEKVQLFKNTEVDPEKLQAASTTNQLGSILNIEANFLSELICWAANAPKDLRPKILNTLLREFEFLITQANQNILLCSGILQAVLKLLLMKPTKSSEFGLLIYSLCVILCRDPKLLKFSKELSLDVARDEYFIFAQIVPLLHMLDVVGNYARDALLLILALSNRDPDVAGYLTSKSDICPVLATSLSGLYSSLPRRVILGDSEDLSARKGDNEDLVVYGAGWHRLTKKEWSGCEALANFLKTLDFCNLAVHISHVSVRSDLMFYVYSGFLLPVLGSALHKNAMDEVIAAEAYLELFLRRLTEPALIGLFLRFIVGSSYDSHSILTSLIKRLDSSAMSPSDDTYQLGMVTLALFRTIVNTNCEDVMVHLIFQYINHLSYDLIPSSNHLVQLQSPSDKEENSNTSEDIDVWLASAENYLELSNWGKPVTKSQVEATSGKSFLPSCKWSNLLLEANRNVVVRAASTYMWHCDYTQISDSTQETAIPRSPNASLVPDGRLRLTNNLYGSTISGDRSHQPSVVDKYNQSNAVYQLSYLSDDEVEEIEDVKIKKVVTPLPDFSPDVSKSHAKPVATSDVFIKIRNLPEGNCVGLVSDFIQILREAGSEVFSDFPCGRRPRPPVDPFQLELIEARLKGDVATFIPISSKQLNKNEDWDEEYKATKEVDNFSVLHCAALRGGLEELNISFMDNKLSPSNTFGGDFGPFLDSLLKRLTNMHKNCLYTNLLLTELIVIIAVFPQSPLPDILLKNSGLCLKPPAQSLFQVLTSVRRELENSLSKVKDWENLVDQAMEFLKSSDNKKGSVNKYLPSPVVPVMTDSVGFEFATTVTEDDLLIVAMNPNRHSRPPIRRHNTPSIRSTCPMTGTHYNMSRSHSASFNRPVLEPVVPYATAPRAPPSPLASCRSPASRRRASVDRISKFLNLSSSLFPTSPYGGNQSKPCVQSIGVQTRNVIFAYIVFKEFCLELASLCCEHSVFHGRFLKKFKQTLSIEHYLL